MEKTLLIFLKLNFTQNTLTCYGLKRRMFTLLWWGPKYPCNVHGDILAEKSIHMKIPEWTSMVHGHVDSCIFNMDFSALHGHLKSGRSNGDTRYGKTSTRVLLKNCRANKQAQGVTTHDIQCTKGLDIQLISLISGRWNLSNHNRFQRFFKFFTLWPLFTDIWRIFRYIQQIFSNGECQLTRMPHIKYIRLGCVRSSHLHLKCKRLVACVQVSLY